MLTGELPFCDVSAYNRFKTSDRSSLSAETMSDYLHVSVNMPCLTNFNAWPAVELFLRDKQRRASSSARHANSEFYVNVFDEASESAVPPSTSRVRFD